MRWTRRGRSRHLEDRRFDRPRMRMRIPGGRPATGLGCGGIVLLIVLAFIFGPDKILQLLDSGGGGLPGPPAGSAPVGTSSAEEEELVDFVSFVLDDAQEVWARLLPQYGSSYRPARLVLFRDAVDSACGFAQAATGPFYCPGDERVYIDLGFYADLRRRFGAPGDFAQAYVLAHEIGHHVQGVLGTERQVRQLQRSRPGVANELSVLMELQADCYAGVWAHSTARRQLLERGDVEEGLAAAAAVGDDRLQRMAGGRVNPDAFTHGTSAQRVEWFRRGLESGDPRSCDTFGAVR